MSSIKYYGKKNILKLLKVPLETIIYDSDITVFIPLHNYK